MILGRALSKGLLLGTLAIAMPAYADDASDLAAAGKAFDAGEYSKGFPIVQAMAERGSLVGMRALGIAYLRGQGVAKDEAKGAEWMAKAAEKGLPTAQHELGVLYLNGSGVEKNQATAAQWFRKAADQGFGTSWQALGRISTDPKEQEDYFRRGSKLGIVGAMLDLSQNLFRQARGDIAQGPKLMALTEAYQWITTALVAIPLGAQRDEIHRQRVAVEEDIKKLDERSAPQIIADAKKLGESIAMEFRAAELAAQEKANAAALEKR